MDKGNQVNCIMRARCSGEKLQHRLSTQLLFVVEAGGSGNCVTIM